MFPAFFLYCFNLENDIDRLSRNVGNYQSTLRNIPEERRIKKCILTPKAAKRIWVVWYNLCYDRIWVVWQKMDVRLYHYAPRFRKKYPFCCNVPRFRPFVLLLIVALMIKWRWVWSNGGMILPGENRNTRRKTRLNVTLPTKNTTEIVICLSNTFYFNSYLTENTVCIDLEGNQLMLLREKIGIYLKIIRNT